MKILCTYLFLLTFICIDMFATPLKLTIEEKNFIKNNPTLKIGMLSTFAPFSYINNKQLIGFEHDLLNIISHKTGFKFEKVLETWPVIYNNFKTKKIDVIASVSKKEYRMPFIKFTEPYYNIPTIIFINDNIDNYKSIEDLKDKKVGVISETFYLKELQDTYNLNLVYYKNYEQLVQDLSFGKIDALIQNLPTVNYLIKKNAYVNIKVAQELILPKTRGEDLRFGTQHDQPLLNSILRKVFLSITDEEKERLQNKWIGPIKEYQGEHIDLNTKEMSYLDIKKIKYCVNPNNFPFEGLDKQGQHIGMSSIYYKLFENMLSSKFELVQTKNKKESLEYIKEHKCDILTLIMQTPERKKYLNFTTHYVEVPLVIATKVNVPFINDLKDLKNSKIGIIKGDVFLITLKEKYPSIEFIEINSISEGLDQVKNNKISAYVDTLASIGYELQNNYFGELKITGKLSETLKLSIGVQKNEKILFTILEKTIKSIHQETHRKIFVQTIPIKYEKIINYDSIWKIVLGALVLILFVLYWSIKIFKANQLLKKAQEEIKLKNTQLENLATTDNLTNLYNRRKIEEILQEEINRCQRFKHTFAITMLDIDYFKDVNDTFGHQIGDKVLIQIANILKKELRKTDFVGRFGGEEFLLICPESNKNEILKLMESLRLKISNTHFNKVGQKTASFGLTIYKNTDTLNSMIKRADDALYQAKKSGRNKIVTNL